MSTGGEDASSSSSEVVHLVTAKDVIDFWFGDLDRFSSDKDYAGELGGKWFGFGPKDEGFIGTQMASKELIQKAASGELKGEEWEGTQGTLAKLLLLDQFPRTAFRGTAQAFATDETAASLSLDVISKGWDALGVNYTFAQRLFVYLPLMHSERLEAQDRCVEKCKLLMEEQAAEEGSANPMTYSMSQDHRDVIAKFGRFPHRNGALGRESTPEEKEWLQSPDIPGWAKSQGAAPTPSA